MVSWELRARGSSVNGKALRALIEHSDHELEVDCATEKEVQNERNRYQKAAKELGVTLRTHTERDAKGERTRLVIELKPQAA